MFCRECGNKMKDTADVCIKCGVAIKNPNAKSQTVYILLGALPGAFCFPGIHNLYAGYITQGLIQLLGSVLTCGILWIPMYIWAIVEICTIKQDAEGNDFV